jgi:hypothetical protein
MAKINSIKTKIVNEKSVELIGIKETDNEVKVMAAAFKKCFDAELSMAHEITLTLCIKEDKDGISIFTAKAVIKEQDVHHSQLSLFDFRNPIVDSINNLIDGIPENGSMAIESGGKSVELKGKKKAI